MLKLKITNKFTASVPVLQPSEKGTKPERGVMTITFNKLPRDERKQIAKDQGLDGLVDAIVHKIEDVEVPDGFDVREAVLNDSPCCNAIIHVYNEKMDGVERKN